MESHSSEKTRGEGVPSTTSTANLGPAVSQDETAEMALCHHIDAQGRRCRMLVMSIEADFCAYHAQRRLQAQRASETAATELLACVSDFTDAASVNRFLGTLIKQVALKRIPRRDGIALAYICQLLLNSLGAIDRKEVLRLEESRLELLSKKNLPARVVWDIPVGPKPAGQQASPRPAESPDHKGRQE